jgi:hypothetical protein
VDCDVTALAFRSLRTAAFPSSDAAVDLTLDLPDVQPKPNRVAGSGLMCHDWKFILATEYRVQWFLEICDLRINE